MSENKKLKPYNDDTKVKEERCPNNPPHQTEDVILPKISQKNGKIKVFLDVIIDGTSSMETIYPFVYNHLCNEAENLKELDDTEISIKTIVVYDNKSQNMGKHGTIDKFKKDLLSVTICGGSENGYEPYLNNALAETVAEIQDEKDADIKCIVLITDSMPGSSEKPEIKFDENSCDLVCLIVNNPQSIDEFIYLNNMNARDIRSFLMSSDYKLLYTEIKKIMEKLQ